MQKRNFLQAVSIAVAALAVSAPAMAQNWKPTRPINLIVPWAAGGSTDQVTRVTAAELEKALGQTIVIVNQPGASGSIGTKGALDAPKDGYTWTAGAAQDLGTYQTLGSLNTSIKDWHLFLNVANIQVIGVNPKTPYNTPKELLDAMKAKPGQISVATAGVTSAGHNAMELISKVTGVKYRHVTYDGGNPAVVATVAGEADVTTQLAVEQADMIRGKRLRPLAAVSDKALELEGYGTIPPLSQTLPGFHAPANYFGIFIPKGVPDDVVKTVERIWRDNIMKSEALKKYATSRGALFNPLSGDDAQKAVFPAIQANAWVLFEGGKAKVSPDTVGIPKTLMPETSTQLSDGASHGDADERMPPRADFVDAIAWIVLGIAVLVGSLLMDRLEAQHINPYTVPGLLPGLLGIAMILLGLVLAERSRERGALTQPLPAATSDRSDERRRIWIASALCLGYGVVLIGHGIPFWIASSIYVTASILVFQRLSRDPEERRMTPRLVGKALLIGVASSVVTQLVFQEVFLVRMP